MKSNTPSQSPPPKPVRPICWEDDFSRNTLDDLPFDNLPPVSHTAANEIPESLRVLRIQKLLNDQSLLDWIKRDQFPIPSAKDREGYSVGFDLDYWLSGLEDYLKVVKVADQYSVNRRVVFDFGCASGRLLRHYLVHDQCQEIWGSDINARHIRWLYEHLPDVKPIFNHSLPILPIRDNSVDLITAFSVFTHIDTFETCWLAELRRIMCDDGIGYLTVHNDNTWVALRDQIDNPENRLIQSILKIDPSVAEKIHQPIPISRTVYRFSQVGPYRAQVFHSNEYLQNVWGRFFKIESILPAAHGRQTVLVLRKK